MTIKLGQHPSQHPAISMEDTKMKLRDLRNRLKKGVPSEHLEEFGRFLADYLNPELNPMGFVMGYLLAVGDLQKGINGFTQQPIRNGCVGYPPIMYGLIQMSLPEVADAVLPYRFAEEVKNFYAEVEADVAKGK